MPPIVQTVATEAEGIQRLIDEIDQHRQHLQASGEAEERVRRRLEREVALLAREDFDAWLREWFKNRENEVTIQDLTGRKSDPGAVAEALLSDFRGSRASSG